MRPRSCCTARRTGGCRPRRRWRWPRGCRRFDRPTYVGRRLGETGYRFPDGSFFRLPAYVTARVHAAVDLTDQLRLSGEVTNLFDEHYYPSSYSRLWITPGAPRQFFVRAGYRL